MGSRVALACRLIEAAESPPSLSDLAAATGLSVWRLHRAFKARTGLTPGAYLAQVKAARAKAALAAGAGIAAAGYEAGYGSSGRFYEAAPGRLGMTPSVWRAGGPGERIRFAVAQTSLGPVLTAATARGICAIQLGDDPDALVRGLQDRFPKAELIGADADFEALTARVVALVEAPGVGADLPLDVRGTAFQERVWRALRAVPPGTVATYAQIAAAIGAPRAVRAVAGACAANPVAVAVPCHRVVRSDGALSGYRWGVERKRELLRREAAG